MAKILVHQLQPTTIDHGLPEASSPFAGRKIGVKRDESADGRLMLQDPPGMPPATKRRIDVGFAWRQLECIHRFRQQYRDVTRITDIAR
jgi:hypothetical protein